MKNKDTILKEIFNNDPQNILEDTKTYNGWKNYETWKVQHEILGPYEHYTEDLTTSRYLPKLNNYTDKDLIKVIATRLMIDTEHFLNDNMKLWTSWNIKYSDVDFYEIATLMFEDYKDNTIID